MNHPWILPAMRIASIAVYIFSFYGLLYYSIFSFLGAEVANSPFGPTTILLILIAAPGLPLLRYWLSDVKKDHRKYLTTRWALMIGYLILGIPISLGLIEYGGPIGGVALLIGLVFSLIFFLFAAAVSFPLYFFASGLLRNKPGHLHAGAFFALVFFPLTTFRLFIAGSDDFGNFFQAWMILAGFLVAWDWGDITVKLTRAVSDVRKGVALNPFASGLAAYVPTGIAWSVAAFVMMTTIRDALIERTLLGGPTSYAHVFFWIAVLAVSILAIGGLVRLGRQAAAAQQTPSARGA